MDRKQTLLEAEKCVCQNRQDEYGSAEDNFKIVADLWNAYLDGCSDGNEDINAHDVAIMMCLLKIARIASGQAKADNYIDLAGYSACACEIATEIKE